MLTLNAEPRVKLGKQAESLLEEGFVPAELYGKGFENVHVKVSTKEFLNIFEEAGESTLVNIVVDKQEYPVLIYDIQRDNLGEQIVHVDFYRVNMKEKIVTDVPLEFENEAPAVKEFDGVLITAIDTVEVEALPAQLRRRESEGTNTEK